MAGLSHVFLVSTTLAFVLFLLDAATAQGEENEQYRGEYSCPNDEVQWYTACFGETPCQTYVKLRSVCEPEYPLPNITIPSSNDQCPSSSESCCCNWAAFQLHMLCLNCQESTSTSNKRHARSDYVEIDGDSHASGDYFYECKPTSSETSNNSWPLFPDNTPANAAIPANADFLFVSLLPGATWSYSETADKFENETKKDQSLCRSTSTDSAFSTSTTYPVSAVQTTTRSITLVTVSGPEPTTSPHATNSSDSENGSSQTERGRSVSVGTIAGIVVAGVLLIGILLGALWYARRQRRKAAPYVSRRDEVQEASGDDKEQPRSAKARKAGAYLSGMSITPLLSRRAGSPATNSSIPPSINFYPDAMVRQGNGGRASPRPFSAAYSETLPGYTGWDRKSIGEKSIGEKSAVSERTDSRVQLSTEDSPDPYMPLQPLRLDSKE